MQSAATVDIHTKPQPSPLIVFKDLHTPNGKVSFTGLRVPTDAIFEYVRFEVNVNEWSFANTFGFDNQLHLVPTFLGNVPAWMYTWENGMDVEKEPTKAWRGKYTVWYHETHDGEEELGDSAIYLFKQCKDGDSAGEPVRHGNLPWPGSNESRWFGKEMDKIKKVLEEARSHGQWNPPFGMAGLTVTCNV